MSNVWPPREQPPEDLNAALSAFLEKHPIPDELLLLYLRLVPSRAPHFQSPDADPTPYGTPWNVTDHLLHILQQYYGGTLQREVRELWAERIMKINPDELRSNPRRYLVYIWDTTSEYVEALEQFLGLSLQEDK